MVEMGLISAKQNQDVAEYNRILLVVLEDYPGLTSEWQNTLVLVLDELALISLLPHYQIQDQNLAIHLQKSLLSVVNKYPISPCFALLSKS